jgi:hypothetical protein
VALQQPAGVDPMQRLHPVSVPGYRGFGGGGGSIMRRASSGFTPRASGGFTPHGTPRSGSFHRDNSLSKRRRLQVGRPHGGCAAGVAVPCCGAGVWCSGVHGSLLAEVWHGRCLVVVEMARPAMLPPHRLFCTAWGPLLPSLPPCTSP